MPGDPIIGPPVPPGPPELQGKLRGRRQFGIVRFDGDWMLTPAYQWTPETDNPWPRSVAVAVCRQGNYHGPDHKPPVKGCTCGLYAYWTFEEMVAQHSEGQAIMTGIVEGWGHAFRGSLGWRAERQQILALDMPTCAQVVTASDGYTREKCRGTRDILLRCTGPVWLEEDAATRFEEVGDEDKADVYPKSGTWMCGDCWTESTYGNPLEVPWLEIEPGLTKWYECDIMPPIDFGIPTDG